MSNHLEQVPPLTRAIRNAWWGIQAGFKFALLFCAWIVVLIFMNGGLTLQMSGGHSVNAIAVIVLYASGGIVGGAIVGLLRSFARTMIGAAITGLLVAVPICFGAVLIIENFAPWDGKATLLLAIMSVFFGPTLGVVFRKINLEVDRKWPDPKRH